MDYFYNIHEIDSPKFIEMIIYIYIYIYISPRLNELGFDSFFFLLGSTMDSKNIHTKWIHLDQNYLIT
jgi:hypothetical protein